MKKSILLTAVLLGVMTSVCMAQSELSSIPKTIEAVERTTADVIRKGEETSAQITSALENSVLEQTRIANEVERTTREATAPVTTTVPGVGTVRSYQISSDMNVDYGLEVPTRRGHTDHFVPMDLTKIIQRWDVPYKQMDMQARWQEIGGKMEYNNQQSLAQDIHRLYDGQGVPAQEVVTRQDVLIYTLPFDGITYTGHNVAQSLQKADFIIVFYPNRNRGQLVQFTPDALRYYRLKPDAVVEP